VSDFDLALGRAASPPATAESLNQPLVGTWRLLALEARGADGVAHYPMGENVVGYLIYTADGYMSGHLMRPGRPGFESGDALRPNPDEAAEAVGGYLSYCGTYEISRSGVVVHHVELSLAPNWIGAEQVRFYELDGDRLTITTRPHLAAGHQAATRLIWERAHPIPTLGDGETGREL
jgi:lipocalin-like protein